MRMRREARVFTHDTVGTRKHAVRSEDWWLYKPGQHVQTVDGPGRVDAVHDGPFPGSEEYEIALDGGLGGGRYDSRQIIGAVTHTQASTEHLASDDYPELGTLLHDRPDPATMKYTASFQAEATAYSDDLEDPDKVYLRFGDWPADERSNNNVTGFKEDGVSTYELDRHGEPKDPDSGLDRWHEHNHDCEPDCNLDQWNEDYGNDTGEEMRGRVNRAEKNRYNGRDYDSDTGHLVKGKFVGLGHDAEPLLQNVRRVGDWIDHRHHFFPDAEPHRLARDPHDEDYEPPEEEPTHHTGMKATASLGKQAGSADHVANAGKAPTGDALADHMSRYHGWPDHLLSEDDDELARDHESDHKEYPVGNGHHHGDIEPAEHWCDVHDEYHDDPQDAEDHMHNGITDWSAHSADIPDEIHRGMNIKLPQDVHDFVHDENRPTHERAEKLLHHLKGGMGIGMHWSTDEGAAKSFAEPTYDKDGSTRVIMTAETPHPDDFETDPAKLDGAFHFAHEESEIPVQRGTPLQLKSLQWNDQPEIDIKARNKYSGPESSRHAKEWFHPYTHHDFEEPHTLPVQDPLFHVTSSLPSTAAFEPVQDPAENLPDVDSEAGVVYHSGHNGTPPSSVTVGSKAQPWDCYVGHEGPCPGPDDVPAPKVARWHHLAMPSMKHPEHPKGFSHSTYQSDSAGSDGPWPTHRLNGYINGENAGHIYYTLHPNQRALKVEMLHVNPNAGGKGVASAMMDKLYEEYPHAWVNHGYRTDPYHFLARGSKGNGLSWWRGYEDPAPERNVHNVHPDKGWGDYFTASRVASDVKKNERNDPGHYDRIGGVPDWVHSHEVENGEWDDTPKKHDFDREDDPADEYCHECEEYGHSASAHESEDKDEDKDEEEEHNPDPRYSYLHHGTAIHLTPDEHNFVHNKDLPADVRAHRLLDIMGRGEMPHGPWHAIENDAHHRSWEVADNLPPGGTRLPPTRVMLHAMPFKHDEVHEQDRQGVETPQFDTDGSAATFQTTDNPINFHLKGMTWSQPGSNSEHNFRKPEAVGIPLSQYHATEVRDNSHDNPITSQERADIRREHHERYKTRSDPSGLNPPGTGEQMSLFSSLASSLPSVEAHDWAPFPDEADDLRRHMHTYHGVDPEYQLGQDQHDRLHEELDEAEDYDPDLHGRYHEHHDVARPWEPMPWEGKERSGGSTYDDADRRALAPINTGEFSPVTHSLSMLVTAAMDPSFRFHVTAAWRDVQNKAKRIRAEGGVEITHASDGMVIGNVRGDHNVYETGLQRLPGKRQSVATYSCGCKWGAYHWGASDDLSRFAGRMCSHALALQYEAASRGMFGRDVYVDEHKPRWVPSKVVVKYDIDTGQHLRAESSLSVPEQSPMLVMLALAGEFDPALHVVTAAVNDLFGDTAGATEPSLMDPSGPTEPWNKEESPVSAGPLTAPEPDNWGSINAPSMFPRIASSITTEAFWQALIPIVRAVAPAIIGGIAGGGKDGAEATLHDEPEPALPTTDGTEHEASVGDIDLVNEPPITSPWVDDDVVTPDSQSIQVKGSAADIVAEFQRSEAAKSLMASSGSSSRDAEDIAGAAEAFLAKTAAFSSAERYDLIEESPGVQASNTDRLDIANTHYAELESMDGSKEGDEFSWLMM